MGNKKTKILTDFQATVFSHEFDHLYGILHSDRAIKIFHGKANERIELRKKEPYKIILKTGKFEYSLNKIKN